jgi:hypothetical protein
METEEDQIRHAIVVLNEKVLGIVLGILFGAALFLATNFLIVKDGPNVGAHLGMLSNFFPGYRVTFLGSLVGFCYMFVLGLVIGWVIGAVYNKIAKA